MDVFLLSARAAWENYLTNALTPLRELTWQTGSLLLIMALSVMLIAYWIARATWLFSKPALTGVKVKGGPHTYTDFLRMNAVAFKKYHRRDAALPSTHEIVKRDLASASSKHFVVTVVESGTRIPLLTREMHLQFAGRRYSVPEDTVQFDSSSLNTIRLGNMSEEDDEEGVAIAGVYDIYIRRVRWYDIRHWLAHPNREIRIVIWVTIITTTLPLLKDLVFGG